MRLNHTLVIIVSMCALLSATRLHAQVAESVFWTQEVGGVGDESRIGKVDLYSGAATTIHSTPGVAIKLDARNGKMYWSDRTTIKRSNLDGTSIETLITNLHLVYGLDLDIPGGKIYFADAQDGYFARANLDGTSVQILYQPSIALIGLALDRTQGKAYLSAYYDNTIIRVNLDGSNPVTFAAGVSNPVGLALDSVNRKLYIAGEATNNIRFCDLDGANGTTFSTTTNPFGIDIDPIYGKVYWTLGDGGIYRANLNGTNSELVSSASTSDGRGIALDIDRDGDGVSNTADVCFNDPNKMNPGACGCGSPDTDNDGDGSANCLDGCPDDSRKFATGICGCGATDLDTNANLVTDCLPEETVQRAASTLKTEVLTLFRKSNSSKRRSVSNALKKLEKAVKAFPVSGTDVAKPNLQSATTTASKDVTLLLLTQALRPSQATFNGVSRKAKKSVEAVSSLLATAR